MATYHITTKEQLQAMNDDLAGDYILDNSISLTGVTWTTIGTTGSPFTGTFDGQNNTISNLALAFGQNSYDKGLFGVVRGGSITNLILNYCSIAFTQAGMTQHANRIGLLVGDILNLDASLVGTIISNVSVTNATISIDCDAAGAGTKSLNGWGGLVGRAAYTAFSNCSISGAFIADIEKGTASAVYLYNIGGICGDADFCSHDTCISTMSFNVQGDSPEDIIVVLGGVMGRSDYYIGTGVDVIAFQQNYLEIKDCSYEGTIVMDSIDTSGVGGLVGNTEGADAALLITNCYSSGSWAFTNCANSSCIAGLIAQAWHEPTYPPLAQVSDCYAEVDISYTGIDSGDSLGCFCTDVNGVYFYNCYVIGTISQSVSGGDVWNVGGFAGDCYLCKFSKCYSKVDIDLTVGSENGYIIESGGFVGFSIMSTFEDCYCWGEINLYTSSDNTGINEIGGFCGLARGGMFKDCYSYTPISCGGTSTFVETTNVGGFFGRAFGDYNIYLNYNHQLNVDNCFSAGGLINLVGGTTQGGFAGTILIHTLTASWTPIFTITNCSWYTGVYDYAVGKVDREAYNTYWATKTDYVIDAVVRFYSGWWKYCICLVSHTSGVFATDLASGKWLETTSAAVPVYTDDDLVPTLSEEGFGTDEPDADLLKHKEHDVFAFGQATYWDFYSRSIWYERWACDEYPEFTGCPLPGIPIDCGQVGQILALDVATATLNAATVPDGAFDCACCTPIEA